MKKLIISLAIIGLAIFGTMLSMLCIANSGNMDMIATNYTFDTAIVHWPDGSMKEIKIKRWYSYADKEQIQIIGHDGNIYVINSVNAVLISHK